LKTLKTVCIASPRTVRTVFKDIESMVVQEETRRGSGVDAALR